VRILHCPTGVGGNAWTLSRAERKLGLDSEVMVYQSSWIGYPADINLHLEKYSKAGRALKMLCFFLKALTQYDIFHFNWGSSFVTSWHYLSFLDLADLPILRWLGKKMVVTYQGSDVRQKSFCANNFAISPFAEPNCCGGVYNSKTDAVRKKRAEKFGRYADKIFALNPDLLHVLPPQAEFLPYANVNLEEWQPVRKGESTKLVILHSPTKRGLKGTKYIIEAVERLRDKYKHVELMLVENIPHSKVQELYRQADLAVDQLLIGWYGGLAVEVMALGKPVVCYIREEDLKFIPPRMKKDLPIINANPDNIFEVLKGLVEDREKLNLIGEQSRAYVERYHDPMRIAERMKEVYESLCTK